MDDNIEVEEKAQIAVNTIPLFIKKLWKMVNDKDAENIISWNATGDGFIIHDQLEFITKLLPQYFKHNNMSSFVRQLNFYNFHKVPDTKDEIQFAHTCFLKDVPEILPFIRRKNTVIKQKKTVAQYNEQVEDLLTEIKNLKGKHVLVDKELSLLKQENAALWNELNSLRLKYTKQSTIINMLIHFLITYIHTHQTSFSKPNIQVSTGESNVNNIKVGPTLLEIGYKNNKKESNNTHPNPFTVLEPETSSSITYSVKLPEKGSESKRPRKNVHSLEEMLSTFPSMKRPKKPQRGLTYSIKLPGNQSDNINRPEVQRSLLEILKENERLCEEDTDEIITDLGRESNNLIDLENFSTEDISNDIPSSSATYTVSYPADILESPNRPPEHLVETGDLTYNKMENAQVDSNLVTNQNIAVTVNNPEATNNAITTDIPMDTTSSVPQNYTIIYPNEQKIVRNDLNRKVNIVDRSSIKNTPSKVVPVVSNKTKSKPKFIKIPVKDLKHPLTPSRNITTNKMKVPIAEIPKAVGLKQNLVPNKSASHTDNPEGTLLEILKENEKLTQSNLNEIPITNITQPNLTNINILIDDPPIEKKFGDFYMDDDGQPIITQTQSLSPEKSNSNSKINIPKSSSKIDKTYKKVNILDNPKENLTTYVDSTQEEIDMLQDILNNLTSNELSEILNADPPITETHNIDLDSDVADPAGTDDEGIGTYMNMDESVDKYFQKHFLENV